MWQDTGWTDLNVGHTQCSEMVHSNRSLIERGLVTNCQGRHRLAQLLIKLNNILKVASHESSYP